MNLYAAPKSTLDEPARGNSGTAVLVGAAVGIGISYTVLTVVGIIFLWVLTLQGVSLQDLYARAYQSTAYIAFAHVFGVLCHIYGGYWSARLASRKPLATALFAGAVVAVFTAITNLMPYELPIPLWSRIAGVLAPMPSFALGALAWRRVPQK
ncbi:hypothetical protein GM658_02095 [Pseudoduganella eburnea]|uniref:Uncharacterized protein n=1 Tax=Massilia eburnea TaxID=1776165 RepID=A0A6L6QBC0_9BURK|nr:hypothetical protein [Massilia eburnea]MTW09379.1 hypothetical protein [Massilia eburnea]